MHLGTVGGRNMYRLKYVCSPMRTPEASSTQPGEMLAMRIEDIQTQFTGVQSEANG